MARLVKAGSKEAKHNRAQDRRLDGDAQGHERPIERFNPLTVRPELEVAERELRELEWAMSEDQRHNYSEKHLARFKKRAEEIRASLPALEAAAARHNHRVHREQIQRDFNISTHKPRPTKVPKASGHGTRVQRKYKGPGAPRGPRVPGKPTLIAQPKNESSDKLSASREGPKKVKGFRTYHRIYKKSGGSNGG